MRRLMTLVVLVLVVASAMGMSPARRNHVLTNGSYVFPKDLSFAFYYKMDEQSGTRADWSGHGSTLTSNNSTAAGHGVGLGHAAKFTAASVQSLSVANNSNVTTGNIVFTIGLWARVMIVSPSDWREFIGKGADANSAHQEYEVYYDKTSGRYLCNISNGTTAKQVSSTRTRVDFGKWAFIVIDYSPTTGFLSIQVNNGPVTSAAAPAGGYSNTAALRFGTDGAGSSPVEGNVQDAWMVKGTVSPAIRTRLYNRGRGNRPPLP